MSLYGDDLTIANSKVSNTDDVTTMSTSYVLLDDMTITPGAGEYLALFSAFGYGDTNDQKIEYALHIDTVVISHTERSQGAASNSATNDERNSLHTQDKVTLAAGEAINVRFKTTVGTAHVVNRSLILLKLKS